MRAWPYLWVMLTLATPALAWAQDTEDEASFDLRYVVEAVDVRGNRKTDTALVLRELGLTTGDVVTPADPRVEAARLRLLSLGYFLDVRLSLAKGQRRGGAILVVDVQERGTLLINALHLGSSDATALWGGLNLAETNFLGRGIGLGGGFVQSSGPAVPGATAAHAFSARASGPAPRNGGLALWGNVLYSDGSEFFRASGSTADADPNNFVALGLRRMGGSLGFGLDLARGARFSTEGHVEALNARFPDVRTRALGSGFARPISFGIVDGVSRLASVTVTLDVDTRSDPVLPADGRRITVSFEAAVPVLGSRYAYTKGVVQTSFYFSAFRDHVLGLHVFAGGVAGNAPYFDRFFVGDLNFLLPPRALGLNFSTRPSRNFLGTGIADHRYDAFASRALVEYAVPLWRRHRFVYRGDAFLAFGAFAMASADDLRLRDTDLRHAVPIDLTGDLGLRLDTYIGIFTVSVANALGRFPF